MPRGRPRKNPEDRVEMEPRVEPVNIPTPDEKRFPREKDLNSRPKKRYRFVHNQQPGTDLEAQPGVTVIKSNGQLGTVHEKYHLEDGKEYDLPVDIVDRWKKLTYDENGTKRVRFVFEEV